MTRTPGRGGHKREGRPSFCRRHLEEEERDEDAPGEERVHWADVVEHVLVVHGEAHECDEKVEPPHHLRQEGGEGGYDAVGSPANI